MRRVNLRSLRKSAAGRSSEGRPQAGSVVGARGGGMAIGLDPRAPEPRAVELRALPLPARPEPLVTVAPGRHPAPPAESPGVPPAAAMPGRTLPALHREGVAAQIETWLRQAARALSAMVARSVAADGPANGPAPRKGRAPYRGTASVPAIARANREIHALREENRRLKFEIAALDERRREAEVMRPA